jgi:hypothetical protein
MQKDSEDAIFCHYEIGTFDSPEPKDEEDKKVKTTVIREHNVAPVSLRFRTSLSRYFAEDDNALTPRNTGIRLHRAFEGATTREEIFAKLDDMVKNGELRQEEVANLKSQISTTLDTTIAGEWFDGSWSALYRERNIVLPNGKSKRPDLVMTRNNEAVVIDIKFGKEERAEELRAQLVARAPDLIRATKRKVSLCKRSDGSYGYNPTLTGGGCRRSQCAPVGLGLSDEGDVNGGSISLNGVMRSLCGALGLPVIPAFGTEDSKLFYELIENATVKKKVNPKPEWFDSYLVEEGAVWA